MKFKVGDKVIGNEKATEEYSYTIKGWIGTVTSVKDNQFEAEGFDGKRYCWLDYACFDLYQEIKSINDLQFADIVTLRNGERYVVADDTLYGEESNYRRDADSISFWYHSDLTQNEDDKNQDIVKIERDGKVIYEREELKIREMTVAEISKALGYDVKVVK